MVWSSWALYHFSCLSGWVGWWVGISESDSSFLCRVSVSSWVLWRVVVQLYVSNCQGCLWNIRHCTATKPGRNRKSSENYWRRRLCSSPEEHFETLTAQWPYQEQKISIALCLLAWMPGKMSRMAFCLGFVDSCHSDGCFWNLRWGFACVWTCSHLELTAYPSHVAHECQLILLVLHHTCIKSSSFPK